MERIIPTEYEEQATLIEWAQSAPVRRELPDIALLYHTPNERKCSPAEGARLKKSGVRRGVPDLVLPVPRGKFHGLFIEMKRIGGKETKEQEWWIDQLRKQGYRAEVCYGFRSARMVIREYLSGEGFENG